MPPPDLTTLTGRLEWVRTVALGGISHEQLAAELAVAPRHFRATPPTLSRYERGRRTPPIPFLAALSDLSGISLDWIVKGGPVGRGTALDAIHQMRAALDTLEERYRETPEDPDPSLFERLDQRD